jgi:hypothetical protein
MTMRTQQLLATALLLPCCLGFTVPQHLFSSQLSSSRRRVELTVAPLIEEEIDVVESSGTARTQDKGDLPTVLQSIADERSEYNLNLGKAMDTLRKDMPEILRRKPGS